MVNKWFIVGAVGVCIWAGFQLPGWFRSGAHLFKAGTAEMGLQISAGDLLGDCGYDLDNFERRRDPSGACVSFIRERLELAKTQGTIVAVQDKNRYGALCIEELLELSDDEVVRLYAGWASVHTARRSADDYGAACKVSLSAAAARPSVAEFPATCGFSGAAEGVAKAAAFANSCSSAGYDSGRRSGDLDPGRRCDEARESHRRNAARGAGQGRRGREGPRGAAGS